MKQEKIKVDFRPRAAFFDLDNTLIDGSSSYYFFKHMWQVSDVSYSEVLRLALGNLKFRFRKEENQSNMDFAVEKLLKFSRNQSQKATRAFCFELSQMIISRKFFPRMLERIEEHKVVGHDTWIISAAPTEIVESIARKLGMTGAIGTKSRVRRGLYTGELVDGLMHGMSKSIAIKTIAEKHKYNLEQSFAYSDSINDLPMLVSVGNPVVVNANKKLQVVAKKNNWQILAS